MGGQAISFQPIRGHLPCVGTASLQREPFDMKPILQLIAELGDSISNILAITSLLPGGWDYQSEPGTGPCVRVCESNGARQLSVDEKLVLTCEESASDKLKLSLVC